MQTMREPSDLTDLGTDLRKVFEVSALLDYPFTFDEVVNYFLPSRNITGIELRSLISNGDLDIPFQIQDGYLFTRPSQSSVSRLEREQFSSEKLRSASKFATMLTRLIPFVRTIAVTGSVAYGSARKWDDIDLFLVTQKNRLWISVFMALMMVRVSKLLGLEAAHLLAFCLSYVHDEEGFREDASRNQINPLFARELLRAKPIAGKEEYGKILKVNNWVQEMFAKSYASRLRELDGCPKTHGDACGTRFALFFDWANGVTYTFLSRYLKLRAYLTNLKLKSQKNEFRIFEPRITPSSCVYTSHFYRWLRSLWGEP